MLQGQLYTAGFAYAQANVSLILLLTSWYRGGSRSRVQVCNSNIVRFPTKVVIINKSASCLKTEENVVTFFHRHVVDSCPCGIFGYHALK